MGRAAKSCTAALGIFVVFMSMLKATSSASLRIVPASKEKLQTSIAANFQFDPPLLVEVIDDFSNRITSGQDSLLRVNANLSDASICLSVDSSFTLVAGVGEFPGSICEPATRITITFTSGDLTSDATPEINVTNEVHLALFQKEGIFWHGQHQQFMEEAVDNINRGFFGKPPFDDPPLPGRNLVLTAYYTDDRQSGAVKAYKKKRYYEKANPGKKAVALIGFGNIEVSKVMLPLTTMDKVSVLSYHADSAIEFSDKSKFPYFNRIVFSEGIELRALAVYLKNRSWMKVIIFRDQNSMLPNFFYESLKSLSITVEREFAVPSDFTEEDSRLDDMAKSMKAMATRIVVTFLKGSVGTSLFVVALRNNVTSYDGFQWIGYDNAKTFPATNQPAGCHRTRRDRDWCNFRFVGMVFMTPFISVGGYRSLEWTYVWQKHNTYDYQRIKGALFHPAMDPIAGASYALGYDAIRVYALSIKALISAKKTITGPTLASTIRESTFEGLTETIRFDGNGDRMNYKALISGVYVSWEHRLAALFGNIFANIKYYFAIEMSLNDGFLNSIWDYEGQAIWTHTLMHIDSTNASTSVDVKTNGGFLSVMWYKSVQIMYPQTGYIQINDTLKNLRTYDSYEGIFEEVTQGQIVEYYGHVGAPWTASYFFIPTYLPNIPSTRQELVPPMFYCVQGCGGGRTNPKDSRFYQNGECIAQGVCECKKNANQTYMWSGSTCTKPVCNAGCQKGTCSAPDVCVCMPGFIGVDCSKFVCTFCAAPGGTCIGPETCKCASDYFGSGCSKRCSCVHGTCNNGASGNGKCASCHTGYIGADCNISVYAVSIPVAIGAFVLFVSLFFLSRYLLARAKLKAALFNNEWIVNWSDVKRYDDATGRSSMFLSAVSMNQGGRERKAANTGVWNGIDVHFQKIDKDTIQLTDSIRLEVKQMRDMHHLNIIALVGACIEAPNVCILTEIAPKGSLEDLLANEDINLPWEFRFSIMKGMCCGLDYIHKSEIRSHGRLKSTNILVDNRWTVKLTGFGMFEFKKDQRNVSEFDPSKGNTIADESKCNYGSLLWTAPEILLTGVSHLDHVREGTQEGDIYSLGMVLSEMCTRDHPFADVMLEKKEIIDLIKGQKDEKTLKVWNDYIAKLNIEAGGLVRPCIKEKQWPKRYEKRKALKTLMESCWNNDPVHRPNLKHVQTELERMDPQRGELMDILVKMLEKYSTNLEDIVSKRTKQLVKEKQKTEDLVARLLPKSVAEDLKQGKRVEPETFEFVSIYFSDIVGFTSIAKASTPLQVVTLLNDMYTLFDSISSNYDIYKVETIGDAYMIVSGLPIRNGDKHAGEICTVAMDLVSAIGSFKIRHMPETQMRLRIGIHTGYVVAGVVGLKMPRYCLFGETVHIASKMESGGKPMCIQVSNDTVEILQRLGGYHLHYRHEVEIKGRVLKTFWLTGKDGYDKTLPTPEE